MSETKGSKPNGRKDEITSDDVQHIYQVGLRAVLEAATERFPGMNVEAVAHRWSVCLAAASAMLGFVDGTASALPELHQRQRRTDMARWGMALGHEVASTRARLQNIELGSHISLDKGLARRARRSVRGRN